MLRELSFAEADAVSGGLIVVTANVGTSGNYGAGAGGHGGAPLLGGLGAFQGADFSAFFNGGLAGLEALLNGNFIGYLEDAGFSDNDGDGVPETPPIVVEAPVTSTDIAQIEQTAAYLAPYLQAFMGVTLVGATEAGVLSPLAAAAIGGTAGAVEVNHNFAQDALFYYILQQEINPNYNPLHHTYNMR